MVTSRQQNLVDSYFQRTVAFWKNVYTGEDVYAVIHQRRREIVHQLIDKLALPDQPRALDLGCGAGWTTVAMAQRGYSVAAVDTVDGMLCQTRQLALRAGVAERVAARIGDANHLSFPNMSFHLVVAMGVLPWLDSLETPVREMARVLKPGGHLIVNVDNKWSPSRLLDPRTNTLLAPLRRLSNRILQGIGLRQPSLRNSMSSIREFDSALSRAGLQKVEGATLGFGPLSLFGHKFLPNSLDLALHSKLQDQADRKLPVVRSAGSQYVVLARK